MGMMTGLVLATMAVLAVAASPPVRLDLALRRWETVGVAVLLLHQITVAVVVAALVLLVALGRVPLVALAERERLTLLRVHLSHTLAAVVAVRLAELLVQAALVAGLTVLTAAPFQRQRQPISAVVAGDAVQVVAALVPVDPAARVL